MPVQYFGLVPFLRTPVWLWKGQGVARQVLLRDSFQLTEKRVLTTGAAQEQHGLVKR